MERFTPQQRLQIVQLYYENGRSVKSVCRAFRPIYGVRSRPTERTIRHTIGKLENNLTLLDDTRPIRPRTDRTVENMAAVNESFAEDFFLCGKLKPVISTTFGSNKTALHAIQP